MLARRLRVTDEALADSVFLDVTGRTAKRLLEMAGDADEFVLPVTQEELAGMVGASRERVNKAIASFIRLGWIEQGDRKYIITDREQLSAGPAARAPLGRDTRHPSRTGPAVPPPARAPPRGSGVAVEDARSRPGGPGSP